MAWSSSSTVDVVELVVYLVVLPFAIYLWRVHGRANLLGSLYMYLYCSIRIAADVISLANRNASKPEKTATILSAIGTSPLLLMLSGFAHYSHKLWLNPKFDQTQRNGELEPPQDHRKSHLLMSVMQIQIHLISGIGVYLSVEGNLNLFDDANTLTSGKTDHADHQREIGAVVFFLLWSQLMIYTLCLAIRVRRTSRYSVEAGVLTLSVLSAAVIVGVKILYTIVYTFDHSDTNLSPILGKLWVKVIFVFLVPLQAIVCLCAGCFLSRSRHQTSHVRNGYQKPHEMNRY